MSIQPVGGVSPTSSLSEALALMGAAGTPGASAAPATSASAGLDGGFASVLGAVDGVTALQSKSNALAVQAVTGDLDDVHDYTVASSEAKLALELTAAVRNKAVDAFSEIMRMQA
ncbi:flagellar hook-basal body complex protein FliE [Cellulomonas triticagri]|uniref:Flagellar hook-basal body complex protein FliE n=1 Tax=Cellulomonas triticagri TaxID=2483352 RepID=A0A3M2J736_9CELL|nr:flagellar hook-basal body complex protein FliE [Cellulomonas triticagri]RMI06755.1 flagellar hook-basal body complex protein FliE [Cellulomonas triticagri]